jgi:hypothetical protein
MLEGTAVGDGIAVIIVVALVGVGTFIRMPLLGNVVTVLLKL